MFIKLTRLDNSPIWINASFVVTVEPRKGGGSIVVPIGDGLDYDVKESPETVLGLVGGAPAAAVVPVPAPKGLAPTHLDVSPDDFSDIPSSPAAREVARPAAAAREKTAPAEPASEAPAEPASEAPAEAAAPDPDAELDVFREAKTVATAEPASADGEKPAKAPRAKKPRAAAHKAAKNQTVSLDDEQIARLRKLAPGSVRKLQNTLHSQFSIADSTVAIDALVEKGVLTLDRDHITWNA